MIEPHVPFRLTLAMLLIAGNAFLGAAAFAIIKVRNTRIEETATSGLRGSSVLRMADIIEEIFGEIEDEFESFQPSGTQTR